MIVVDASVLIEALVGDDSVAWRLQGATLTAPHLVDAEVGIVVRRRLLRDQIDLETAEGAIDDLRELEISRFDHVGLLNRAWELRHNVSFSDGLYVALAERLAAPLVTLDARLAAVPGLPVTVEVPGQ